MGWGGKKKWSMRCEDVHDLTSSLPSSASLLTIELAFSIVQTATFTPSSALASPPPDPWKAWTLSCSRQIRRNDPWNGPRNGQRTGHTLKMEHRARGQTLSRLDVFFFKTHAAQHMYCIWYLVHVIFLKTTGTRLSHTPFITILWYGSLCFLEKRTPSTCIDGHPIVLQTEGVVLGPIFSDLWGF